MVAEVISGIFISLWLLEIYLFSNTKIDSHQIIDEVKTSQSDDKEAPWYVKITYSSGIIFTEFLTLLLAIIFKL